MTTSLYLYLKPAAVSKTASTSRIVAAVTALKAATASNAYSLSAITCAADVSDACDCHVMHLT